MAELAERSGLPVPTIKYYLREGLLPAGESVGATRSRYDESHVNRLQLIRALTEVAHLRLETVRAVLEDIDHSGSWQKAVGSAHMRLTPAGDEPASAEATAQVAALLERHDWTFPRGHLLPAMLARSVDAMSRLGHPVSDALLDAYVEAMRLAVPEELVLLRTEDPELAAQQAVIGTLVLEPVLLTIRRMAQQQRVMRNR